MRPEFDPHFIMPEPTEKPATSDLSASLCSALQSLEGRAQFWEAEAKEWRRLFEEQRGGKAFNDLQSEVIELRKQNTEH